MNGTLAPLMNGTIAIETGVSRPPNSGGDLLALHEFARRNHAFGGVAFVVADQKFDLLAKQAALGVDLVDRERQAPDDCLAGLRRLAGHGSDEAELERVLRLAVRVSQPARTRRQAEWIGTWSACTIWQT